MEMDPLPVDILQLRRRDPAAWTSLLTRSAEMGNVIVIAVTAEPLCAISLAPPGRVVCDQTAQIRRYILSLDDCSDPISFIAKGTNHAEAFIYKLYGDPPGTAMPTCRYAHLEGDNSWIILDDVPDHFPPPVWTPAQVEGIVTSLARLHAARWERETTDFESGFTAEPIIPHFLFRPAGPYRWEELQQNEHTYFNEELPSIISRHTTRSAGRLAPQFMRAATGLHLMRELGGWPGVLDEDHLSAAADLLDDPVPMLSPLLDLPVTLIHGQPHPGHWRLTLFDESYLIDWSKAQVGPGILDLVAFLEGYPIVAEPEPTGSGVHLKSRELSPALEQTIIDTYLLTLGEELGRQAPTRAIRAALPAARCLHTLTAWFPFFAAWAKEMPNRELWQKITRLDEAELLLYPHAPSAGMRHYLAGVFERFLRAYRAV
jgi:hypothetical protein